MSRMTPTVRCASKRAILGVNALDAKLHVQMGHTSETDLHENVLENFVPGLRLGWIIAPEEVISKLVLAKQALTCTQPPSTISFFRIRTTAGLLYQHILHMARYIMNAVM